MCSANNLALDGIPQISKIYNDLESIGKQRRAQLRYNWIKEITEAIAKKYVRTEVGKVHDIIIQNRR